MNNQLNKYFWSLNPQALKETPKILKDPENPKFISRMIMLLSTCDRPRELFSLVSREIFIEKWPVIKRRWRKSGENNSLFHWWDAIYDQIVQGRGALNREKKSNYLKSVGQQIKDARLGREWTQKDLAGRVDISQRKISQIENGQANITLETLIRVARVLGIESINLGLK